MPSSPALPLAPGACYRFTVASADEAAALIRERLGPGARVLSVRSVPASGLRFWGAPRLEVVAQLDPAPAEEPVAAPAPALALAAPAFAGPRAASGRPEIPARAGRVPLQDLLRRSGLSEVALGRLQSAPFWAEVAAAPLHRGLVEIGRHLRREADRRAPRAPLTRAAFLGTAGSGRTTALCKWLGAEVFRHGRLGHVVTTEFDRPNPPGPLPVFCEALGVPMARFPASTRPSVAGGFVYLDLPGLSLREPADNVPLARFLDREGIAQRVLVLNAAYDHATLRASYAAGRALGATHLVFTHLDEVAQWGRLWDYLFDGALEPLFLATGPSLTGDCEEDVCGALVRRTLSPADASPADDAAEDETEALAASDHS
jgi:flagellar biosynthesis protein FlhF